MTLAIVAILAATLASLAHEAERTKVTLNLESDGSFVLDVANDPMWLLLRLETFAGGLVPAGLTPVARDAGERLKQAISVDLTKLNKAMNDAGIPHIAVRTER